MCGVTRFVLGVSLLLSICSLRAVIFYETGDPTHNTNAPGGSLTNSGWQLQGAWIGFLGTPIGPNHFIAAKHTGGVAGDIFWLDGTAHTTVARHDDPSTDLTIWEVTPPFRNWAQLYMANDEPGKRFVLFGRGGQRGAPVLAGFFGQTLKGWSWGTYDSVIRWGENSFADVLTPTGIVVPAASTNGTLLRAFFEANGSPNEATLSEGDSGGGVFVQDEDAWKLAAINYAVDGRYNTNSSGPGFSAAIFDRGGLFSGAENRWIFTPDLPGPQPGSFFMSRISIRVDWIRSVIGDPGLPPAEVILEYTTALDQPFAPEPAAIVDRDNLRIRTPNTQQQRFFRVRAAAAVEITGLAPDGGDILLQYRYP